jgi:hypothetical protein
MQKALLLAALMLPLGLFAGASANPVGQCSDTTELIIILPAPVTLPLSAVGGQDITASVFYVGDRGGPAISQLPANTDLPNLIVLQGYVGNNRPGYAFGSGTWMYAETNGVAGLQKGGFSHLPDSPLTGHSDPEIAACVTANPDALIF